MFFLLSSFLLLAFVISVFVNYNNRRDGTGRRDNGTDTGGRAGGQWAGGRGEEVAKGRKTGWRGTLGQRWQRDRLPKEANENVDRRMATEDKAGARAGKSGRRPGNIAVVLPLSWLFCQDMDNCSPKYNAL